MIDHLALYPGRGTRCACAREAVVFARCAACRAVVARCGDPKCGDAWRDAGAHCGDPWDDVASSSSDANRR